MEIWTYKLRGDLVIFCNKNVVELLIVSSLIFVLFYVGIHHNRSTIKNFLKHYTIAMYLLYLN